MGTRAGNELPVSLGPALEMQGEELRAENVLER